MQEQWSKQVLKALKQRRICLGKMRKKKSKRKCFKHRAIELNKLNRFFRQEKYRSHSQIQADCFVVLQKHKTDARPCNVVCNLCV